MLLTQPENNFERYIMEHAHREHIPVTGTFELTPLCNMNCGMCYIRMTPEEMHHNGRLRTLAEWKEIADQALEAGAQFILLTGGEPMLYPGFSDIYTYLRARGTFVTVNTNATQITPEIIKTFQTNYPRRVNVSLYGASNEVYERLCSCANGYDQAMRGIRMLLEAGVATKLNYVLTRENIGEVDQISRISEELGVPVSVSSYLFPPVRKDRKKQSRTNPERLSPCEVAEAQIRSLECGFPDKQTLRAYLADRLREIDEREQIVRAAEDPLSAFPEEACGAGRRSFWIDWQGRMSACGMMTEGAIVLGSNSFQEAWNQICERSEHILVNPTCNNCKYKKICQVCPASALAETGSTDGIPDYHCACSRELERKMREYLEEGADHETK